MHAYIHTYIHKYIYTYKKVNLIDNKYSYTHKNLEPQIKYTKTDKHTHKEREKDSYRNAHTQTST